MQRQGTVKKRLSNAGEKGLAINDRTVKNQNDSELQQPRLGILQKKCYNLASDINYLQLQTALKKLSRARRRTCIHQEKPRPRPSGEITKMLPYPSTDEPMRKSRHIRFRQKMTK